MKTLLFIIFVLGMFLWVIVDPVVKTKNHWFYSLPEKGLRYLMFTPFTLPPEYTSQGV